MKLHIEVTSLFDSLSPCLSLS